VVYKDTFIMPIFYSKIHESDESCMTIMRYYESARLSLISLPYPL